MIPHPHIWKHTKEVTVRTCRLCKRVDYLYFTPESFVKWYKKDDKRPRLLGLVQVVPRKRN